MCRFFPCGNWRVVRRAEIPTRGSMAWAQVDKKRGRESHKKPFDITYTVPKKENFPLFYRSKDSHACATLLLSSFVIRYAAIRETPRMHAAK